MTMDAVGETVKADDVEQSQSQHPHEEAPSWWIGEGLPGAGDRPDWLPEKFKSLQDLSKSYNEVEKRLHQELHKAPEKYDFTKADWVDPEYEPFSELADFAKKNHVSQDVMDKMLDTVGKYLNEFTSDMEEERSQLGPDARERLEVLNNWAKSNLSEESYFALTSNMRTASAVKAIEELRNKMLGNNTLIPTGNENTVDGGLTVSDIEQEMVDNLDKYQKDAKYRAEIKRKIETALQREQSN